MSNVTELVKEYLFRKHDRDYVYKNHGITSHYSKESRWDVSSKYETAKNNLEEVAPGLAEVLDGIIKEAN